MLMMLKKEYSGIMGCIFPVGDMRVVSPPERCSCFLNNDLIKDRHCSSWNLTKEESDALFDKLEKVFDNKD